MKKPTLKIKTIALLLAGAGLSTLPYHVQANPNGGQVVAGNATIKQESATKIGIVQTTAKAIIDWQKYSIGANEHVQYYQPSASSVTLNRVVGQDPSQILGRLTANGQVFLVNPNGIYFGKNAQIDVAGLVASTHNIRNEDFMAGKYDFNIPGKPGTAVINEGTIRIADTGIAAFVAPSVANRGVIVAKLGKVALAAASGFTLDFHGDDLLTFLVNDEVAQTAFDIEGKQLTSFVENSGRIEAQGGYVLLTAKAAESAIHGVINHSGVIEATTVGTENGEIILHAGKGSLKVSGTLDASASQGGDGGFIETSGGHVDISPETIITTAAPLGKTGKWLIDPTDYIIAASGGHITGSLLSAYLALNHVEIQTLATGNSGSGDIYVRDAVTWNTLNKLTLTAHRNINIEAAISANGGGSVKLRADSLGTGAGTVVFGPSGRIRVNNASVGIYYNPVSYNHAGTKSDLNGNPYSAYVTASGSGSMSAYMLVNNANQLQSISNNLLGIYALGRNIDASSTSGWNAGAGFLPIGSVGNQFTGILDGQHHVVSNLVINRPTSPFIALFGYMNGTVRNIGLANVNITGGDYSAGIAGFNYGTISGSYTSGNISGGYSVGGLVADNFGTITKSYSNADVITYMHCAGGIAGHNRPFARIDNSYSTGRITGSFHGGLVGHTDTNSIIVNSYSIGYVDNVINGGLVSSSSIGWEGDVENSYWDTQTSGQTSSAGGTGKSTSQMKQQTTYAGWDFTNIWTMQNSGGYPSLRTPIHVTSTLITPTTEIPVANTCQPASICGGESSTPPPDAETGGDTTDQVETPPPPAGNSPPATTTEISVQEFFSQLSGMSAIQPDIVQFDGKYFVIGDIKVEGGSLLEKIIDGISSNPTGTAIDVSLTIITKLTIPELGLLLKGPKLGSTAAKLIDKHFDMESVKSIIYGFNNPLLNSIYAGSGRDSNGSYISFAGNPEIYEHAVENGLLIKERIDGFTRYYISPKGAISLYLNEVPPKKEGGIFGIGGEYTYDGVPHNDSLMQKLLSAMS